MAEFVQRHMESMAEEIEEMKTSNLYTLEETRLILKTRKEFEYKINGVSKSLQDFEDYIIYEKVLLKQIHNRQNKNVITEIKTAIEYKILRRIKNLYEVALQRFSSNVSLCLSYFKFCKQSNYINAANVAVQNMIKNCAQNPIVWQIAAAWYARDRNDLNNALKVLNKGLTIHKNSQALYTEAIKLQLSVMENGNGTLEEKTEVQTKSCKKIETDVHFGSGDSTLEEKKEVKTKICKKIETDVHFGSGNGTLEEKTEVQEKICKKLETYVHLICDCINDPKYLIEILNLLEEHSFTTNVQNLIINRLLSHHSSKEFVWHTLAQREKRGIHYGISTEELRKSSETGLTRCFCKYQEGLKKVSSSEKANLFSMYLDCLVKAQHEDHELPNTVKINLLKSALEQASNEKYLTEKYYIKWLEFITDEEALIILKKGTEALPHSVDLWKLQLRYAIMTDKNVKVDEVFNAGMSKLKERSLPLWFMYLRYYGLLERNDVIKNIYMRGIKQPPEVSAALKPRYIEWIALVHGITKARKVYNELAHERPYCKELHLTMSMLESTEIDHDYEVWSRVHELACKQFGKNDVDVWINHILFYIHYGKSAKLNENVQSIYREALNTLSALLQSEFKEKYAKALSDR